MPPSYPLPDSYRIAFEAMLLSCANRCAKRLGEFVALWPLGGRQYARGEGILFVGRAVNDWDSAFTFDKLTTQQAVGQQVLKLRGRTESIEGCPLEWASIPSPEYNPHRSAFWRVVRSVTEEVLGAGDQWHERIAYSNLYKIAPRGRNPSEWLCDAQAHDCAQLLELEIEHWRPRFVLIMSGVDWAGPLFSELGLGFTYLDSDSIQAVFRLADTKCVVVPHPQGKRERPIIDAVITAAAPPLMFEVEHIVPESGDQPR